MKRQDVCSFFVSTTHLLTIILPYINEKMNEGKNVKIISQQDLSDDVKKYLKSVKEFNNENIKKVCWKKIKEDNINENTVLFNIGNKEFIESFKNRYDCEIVKCYEIENIDNIQKIINENDYYLRTDGKLKIIKNSQNEQNSNTIKSQS